MRKVCYSVAMSLDGYIAGPEGEIDWIVMDPDIDFGELMSRFDTLLVGRKSWQAMQGGGPGMADVKTYVFSGTLSQDDCAGATLSDSPAKTVTELKGEEGRDIWLFGGGSLFRTLLEASLVDSVEVAVIPVLLGSGIPLLPTPAAQTRLKLTHHRLYEKTGTIQLNYVTV